MRGDPPCKRVERFKLSSSTPHARGSTPSAVLSSPFLGVYPACAGIHLLNPLPYSFRPSLPRMRGDPPGEGQCEAYATESTPHARGST